jgi:hypothetical protein
MVAQTTEADAGGVLERPHTATRQATNLRPYQPPMLLPGARIDSSLDEAMIHQAQMGRLTAF